MASVQKFLKSGTEIVVRSANNGFKSYKTQEEVTLPSVEVALNPLTNDECLKTEFKGVTIWFAAKKMRSRIVLDETKDVTSNVLNEQLYLLHYDVPSTGESKGFSPCARLYRAGAVPCSESAWIVRAGNMPYNLINDMEDMGCNVNPSLLDLSETRTQIAKAVAFLQKTLDMAIESANLSMSDAEEKLEVEGATNTDKEANAKAYVKRAKEVEARLKKRMKDMQIGTDTMGIASVAYGPEILGKVAAVVRSKAMERAKAYAAGTAALATVGTGDATALLTQAKNDELPAFVLSDVLRDAGKDGEADAINDVFDLTDGANSQEVA